MATVSAASLAVGVARPAIAFADANDGRKATGAVLAGVLLPSAAAPTDRDRLRRRLAALAGRQVTVLGASPALDRRGRYFGLLASEDGRLLQTDLLEDGLVAADGANGPCASTFLQAEARARREKRGIWRQSSLITDGRDASGLPDFVIMRARVLSVGKAGRTTYLNFGPRFRTDATVRIGAKAAAELAAAGRAPDTLAGRVIEVRGWAERHDGLDLRLSGAAALSVIGTGNDFGTR